MQLNSMEILKDYFLVESIICLNNCINTFEWKLLIKNNIFNFKLSRIISVISDHSGYQSFDDSGLSTLIE